MTNYNEQAPLAPDAEMVPDHPAAESALGAIATHATEAEARVLRKPSNKELLTIADILEAGSPDSTYARSRARSIIRAVEIMASFGSSREEKDDTPVDLEYCSRLAQRHAAYAELEERVADYSRANVSVSLFD